jgi:long-subunit fatty acid transport protein
MMLTALVLTLIAIDPGAGTSGFDFIRIAPTAREAAMGTAALAKATSPMNFWFNPAHAAGNESQQVHFGYINYVAGIHIGSAAFSQSLEQNKGIGIGIVYLNSGSMKRTDERGNELGTFGVSYADLNVSGGWQLADFVTVGAGIQGLYGSIDTFFTIGLAGNAAVKFGFPVNGLEGLNAALVARNLGLTVKPYNTQRDPLPMSLGVGIGYDINDAVRFALDVVKPLDNQVQFSAGVEGWIGEILALRAGYSSLGPDLRSGGGSDILAGLSTGLGIRYRGYQLDYCFTPMVELGMAHRLSLALTL